jgi:hypothetical protein
MARLEWIDKAEVELDGILRTTSQAPVSSIDGPVRVAFDGAWVHIDVSKLPGAGNQIVVYPAHLVRWVTYPAS